MYFFYKDPNIELLDQEKNIGSAIFETLQLGFHIFGLATRVGRQIVDIHLNNRFGFGIKIKFDNSYRE